MTNCGSPHRAQVLEPGERFLLLRVDISRRRSTRELRYASAHRPRCSIVTWCLRDCGEHRLIRPRGKRPRPRWRGCARSPTSGTACYGPSGGTTTRHGPPSGTSGNGATRSAVVSCSSPAAASSYGPACGAAYRRSAATGGTARCRATPRDPSCRAAAATGHDETPRAARHTIGPERIAYGGRATVAKGTDRNARAAA